MNDTKRSFILHLDTLAVLDELDDKQAGKLFKAIKAYQLRGSVLNNQDVDTGFEGLMEDFVTRIAFAPFKAQFDRDTEEYIRVKENNQEKGRLGNLKRWNKELYDKVLSGELTQEEAEEIARAKKSSGGDEKIGRAKKSSLNGNDSDSDNDSDKEEKKYIKKEKSFKEFTEQDFKEELKLHSEKYSKEMLKDFFIYWTEPNEKGKMKFQLQKTWSTAGRLSTWSRNDFNGNSGSKPKETKQSGGHIARDGTRITMF